MPRKPFNCDPSSPYHLVGRTNNRNWFAVPLPTVWSIFSDQLYFLHHAYKVRIRSFVLMANHFHLIASFPEGNFGEASCAFMGNTSRILSFEARTSNHVYGSRVYRSRLGSYRYYLCAYKYVYQNPIRAGVCRLVEDYPYSTLHGLLGRNPISIPLDEDTLLFDDPQRNLEWLNTLPSDKDVTLVKAALRRADFKIRKDPNNNKPHRLETQPF